ncbi:hypothetical protein J416_05113 [Gracilibacillus halophilus YIM-C55.5]|uniref:Helicase Helix-turn-helix domain-containing protein n=1 Tax=Gracilibacillus halophilus YIM-C55.5 TaxID=1308866 RepID=N4WMF8_9BACI|nr:helix-turn-helix domain-containing protein [Gracilibacillus halophilus]ENH97367.1 hypothetical protein J416_05113 [Gracilibacillus halophilus YIM-C55.5]
MFTYILLDSICKLRGERTVSNIYHLLTAKKSTQTIQDSYIYQLTNYFGIYKRLERKTFQKELRHLYDQGWIEVYQDKQVVLTTEGRSVLNGFDHSQIYLNGMKYDNHALFTMQVIQLLVQTCTHIQQHHDTFIPVVDDESVQQKVKEIFYYYQKDTNTILYHLYQELTRLFEQAPEPLGHLFTDQLTTPRHIGSSKIQLAREYGQTVHDMHCQLMNLSHFLCFAIEKDSSVSFLKEIVPHERNMNLPLTGSAQKTYKLWQKGHGLEMIASQRNLKISTIQDHMVEIAYVVKNFDYSPFLSDHQLQWIANQIDRLQTNKLKEIKESLDDHISYFQIKLVLAMSHQQKEGVF